MHRFLTAAALVVVLATMTTFGCSAALRRISEAASAVQLSTRCSNEIQLGQPDQALRDCNAAVRAEPAMGLMYYYRAFAYEARADFKDQLRDLDRSIGLSPTFADAWAARCAAQMRHGTADLKEAKFDCDKAVALGPNDDVAIHSRLALRVHMKDYHGALADASTLADLHPDSAYGHIPACEVYVKMQRYEDARQSCGRAETAPRDRVEGYMSAAVFSTMMNDWVSALADSDSAIELSPSNAETYNNRCWVRIRMNDVAGAQKDCQTALAMSSNTPHIRDTRSDILIRLRDYKAVIADEDSMVAGYPSSPYGFAGHCAAEQKMHELGRAFADCQRAIALDRDSGQWLVLLGNVYRAQGVQALARANYERARALDPTAIEALREEAQLDEASGDSRGASSLAASYVAKNEYDPVGHQIYGEALASLGDRAQALRQLQAARAGYVRRGDSVGISEVDGAMSPLKSVAQPSSEAGKVVGEHNRR